MYNRHREKGAFFSYSQYTGQACMKKALRIAAGFKAGTVPPAKFPFSFFCSLLSDCGSRRHDLLPYQARELSVQRQQVFIGPFFRDTAFFQHDDPVKAIDG